MTHSKANRRADRFHFGFCNAFERSALESADQIRARLETVQDVAGYVSQDDCYAVMAGVHSALAAINGELDSALHTALEFGLSLEARNGLRDMILSGLADRALLKEAETLNAALQAPPTAELINQAKALISENPQSLSGVCLFAGAYQMIDILPGDTVIYRRTRVRCETSATVEKANRVTLKLVADYQPSPTVPAIQVHFSLPRTEVDEVWREGKKVYDSGRKSCGLTE